MERYELPKGWEWRRLSNPEVCILNPKKSELKNISALTEVTFVPMSAVDEVSGAIANPEIRKLTKVRTGYTYFAEGDVIFAKITPCMENGKSAIAHGLNNGIGFGSTEFHVFRPQALLTPEWLYMLLRSKDIRDVAKISMCGAAGQQRVPIDFFKELEIPVPPISEQRRIVNRIKELTRRAEQARQLRKSIVEEAEKYIPAAIASIFGTGQNHGWVTKKISEICDKPQYGYTESACHAAVGPKFLRITDIQDGTVEWDKVPYCKCDDVKKYRLRTGDIVFARTGATTGKSYLIYNPPEAIFASYLIRLRVGPSILPEFLYWYFQSSTYWASVSSGIDEGNRPNMNGTKLANLEVSYPEDKAEQYRIVGYLNSLKRKAEILKQLQTETEKELAAFTPSVLSKAIRGEL